MTTGTGTSTSRTSILQTRTHVVATLSLTICGWTSLFIAGALRWPGASDERNCPENYLENEYCYCERPRTGAIILQPVNTWSNLSYAIGALVCAWSADSKSFPRNWWQTHVNMLSESRYFSVTFCLALTNISYSSGFMHAGFTTWGTIFDKMAIFVFFVWLEVFSMIKFWLMVNGWTPERIAVSATIHGLCLGAATIVLFALFFTVNISSQVQGYISLTIAITLVLEVVIRYWYAWCKKKKRMSQVWIIVLGVLLLFGGFAMIVRNLRRHSHQA